MFNFKFFSFHCQAAPALRQRDAWLSEPLQRGESNRVQFIHPYSCLRQQRLLHIGRHCLSRQITEYEACESFGSSQTGKLYVFSEQLSGQRKFWHSRDFLPLLPTLNSQCPWPACMCAIYDDLDVRNYSIF